MKIAVTSASGQLGGEIVKALIDKLSADQVVALARTPAKAEYLGTVVRPGDYTDREGLTTSLAGINTVLLVSGNTDPALRIGQHRNVIEAAKSAGVQKIVYTSVQGAEENTAFSPIIQSNRQTESDIRNSGLDWVIGRNGIYIEPDVEYIEEYKKAGCIANCAGDGKCGYTTRPELGHAYAQMLIESHHNGQTYNLHGEPLTQSELVSYLNTAFGLELTYEDMSVEAYRTERIEALGEFMGTVIAGIYEGIRMGKAENESHYEQAAGRPHLAWEAYFSQLSTV